MEYIKIIYYSIFFNYVASAHEWFQYEIKNILRNNFYLESETEQTEIIFDRNSYYALGLIISGLIWAQITKYITPKKALLFSCYFQGISFIIMSIYPSPKIIPFIFLIKGVMTNIYNAGIAFIYTFCSS